MTNQTKTLLNWLQEKIDQGAFVGVEEVKAAIAKASETEPATIREPQPSDLPYDWIVHHQAVVSDARLLGGVEQLVRQYRMLGSNWNYAKACQKELQKRADRAERTLKAAGYTDEGGELWKPPIGPSASPMFNRMEELRQRAEAAEQTASELRVALECESRRATHWEATATQSGRLAEEWNRIAESATSEIVKLNQEVWRLEAKAWKGGAA